MNLKYDYNPNLDVSSAKLSIFFHIVSTVFITAFFLRSMSISSVRKSTKSGKGSLTDLIGQKKVF
jgi:hypothetical protein